MIPKIIHQTWKNADIPLKWKGYQQSWKKFNPDYEYRLWTDQDIDGFMQEHFKEYYDFFCTLHPVIKKVDFFRYCLMYKMGGIYADMDMECLKPIHPIIQGNKVVIGKTTKANTALSYGYPDIEIAFLASAPGLSFWLDLLKFVKKREESFFNSVVRFFSPSFSTLLMTGPNTLTVFLNKYKKLKDFITFLPPAFLFPRPWGDPTVSYKNFREKGYEGDPEKSYAIHHYSSSWMDESTIRFVYHFQKYSYYIIIPVFVIIISLSIVSVLHWLEIF